MYKKFYGFREMPFSQNNSGKLDTVYLSQNYSVELPDIISSLDNKISLTLILGENGVGKTTLVNYMCNFFPQAFSARLINSQLKSTQAFFQHVLTSFEQEVSSTSSYEMLLQLSFFLNSQYTELDGQSSLLIIDNADSMTLDTLKGIELLLGLNAEGSQIIQIILVGRPKLKDFLNKPNLSGLLQNTRTLSLINPLTVEESQEYILHKINLVSSHNNTLFNEQSCSTIYEYSRGIPSIINWLCDKSLSRGCELEQKEISSELILEIINTQVEATESKNTISPTLLAVFAGLILTAITLVLFLANQFAKPSELSKKSPELITEKPLFKPSSDLKIKVPEQVVEKVLFVQKAPPQKTTKQRSLTSKDQFAIAAKQMASLKFSSPIKDNAYETYTAILKADPKEKRAIEGLQRIASYYLKQAKKQQTNGKLEKSFALISKGLMVSPNHADLILFKYQVSAEINQAIEQIDTINLLFKQAELQIKNLQLTKPLNHNAYQSYQKIITLDKDNTLAKNGILKILSKLTSQAQKFLAKKSYSKALKKSNEILALPSEGSNDSFHKRAVFAANEIKKNVVDTLLSLANDQLKTLKPSQPLNSNVFASFNAALQISPNNKEAKKGLNKLKIKYQEFARSALSEKNVEQAIKITYEGLKAFPNNSVLQALQSNAMLQQDQDRNKAKSAETKNVDTKSPKLKSFGTF